MSRRHSTTDHSSRAAYPNFLSLQDTAIIQLKAAGKGLLDAFRWDVVIARVSSDAEIRSNVAKSLLLNTVSLASIYFFDLLLLPLTHEHTHWLRRNVGWFYQVLWLFPVVGVSLYLNSSWCAHLARRSFTLQHGSRAAAEPPATYVGILNSIATSAYCGVMVFTSVVISFALRCIPYVGPTLSFVFFCWVDSYYCFEPLWIARGYSLSRRMRHLEERWAYYFAFGLPSTFLCMSGSTLANAAVFALIYPAYIIMAMRARATPIDPYNPTGEEALRHPSPFIPIRIPVFSPVIWLNDMIVRIISLIGSVGGPPPSHLHSSSYSSSRHRRVPSDSVESVEEGDAVPLQPVSPATSSAKSRPSRIHVNRGTQDKSRKLD